MGLASNLDNLGVGVAYGLRGIKVPTYSNGLMAMVTTLAVYLSIAGGDRLSQLVGGHIARYVGIGLMAMIGVWISFKALTEGRHRNGPKEVREVWCLRLKHLGLVINILQEPSRADADCSGTLDPKEAIVLGISLALNGMAGGFSIGLLQFPAVATSLAVGLASYASFSCGLSLGRALETENFGVWAGLGSGVLMILLAWWQLV